MSEQTDAKQMPRWKRKLEVDEVELKTIEIRINEIKDATQRSRFVFAVMTIVAASVLTGLWNGMLSWERDIAFAESSSNNLDGRKDPNRDAGETRARSQWIQENQQAVRGEWFKNLTISVGLLGLGIRVSISDLAVIGSISFVVIMVWLFFCERTENRAIVDFLRYCNKRFNDKKVSQPICNLAYEAVVRSMVFIDMGRGDNPIQGIIAKDENARSNRSLRSILNALRFLPPFTIVVIVYSDIASLFMHSYLSDTPEVLWKALLNGNHPVEITKIALFDSFAIVAGIYTWHLCKRCQEFSKATAATIRDFKATCCPDQ